MPQITVKPYDINDAALKAIELQKLARRLMNDPALSADARAQVASLESSLNSFRQQIEFLQMSSRKGLLRWFNPTTAMWETITFDVRFIAATEGLQLVSNALFELAPTFVAPAIEAIEKRSDVEAERRAQLELAKAQADAKPFDLSEAVWTVGKWGAIGLGTYYGAKFVYAKWLAPRKKTTGWAGTKLDWPQYATRRH